MIGRSGTIALVALIAALILGAAVGGVSQLTAVDVTDPRPSNPLPSVEPTPTEAQSPSPQPEPTATASALGLWTHTVQDGESISSIAIRFGTTTETLIGLNPEYQDNEDLIEVAATIIVPCTQFAQEEDLCR